MMDGIIPLYKERGLSSHDCVNHLRKLLHMKKIGHSGTLDPTVDGVLPICVGSATKVVDYLMTHRKVYRGSVTLGYATETEDLEGAEVARKAIEEPFTDKQIDTVLQSMVGELKQIPPMFSAVKVNGRKLYQYALAGEEVERPVRVVQINDFHRLGTSRYDATDQTQTIDFEVSCSKGTYVRTLAVEVGEQLGVPAVMSSLTRHESGGFTLEEAFSLDQVREMFANDDFSFLYPLDRALPDYPQVELTVDVWEVVQHGVWLLQDEVGLDAPIIALRYQDQTKCLYKLVDHKYKPLKMFSTK